MKSKQSFFGLSVRLSVAPQNLAQAIGEPAGDAGALISKPVGKTDAFDELLEDAGSLRAGSALASEPEREISEMIKVIKYRPFGSL